MFEARSPLESHTIRIKKSVSFPHAKRTKKGHKVLPILMAKGLLDWLWMMNSSPFFAEFVTKVSSVWRRAAVVPFFSMKGVLIGECFPPQGSGLMYEISNSLRMGDRSIYNSIYILLK